ncbi:MAG: SDR family NAD(P)-dependent oxidoreductase [Flavobacteriales bacterium]|nr:SDR family NAD(P)-dependent oxidoreductase [Flavobacteriales bacterium]
MIALITGATSGIGMASAKKLAKQGYDLIITGRRKDRLDKFSLELKSDFNIEVLALNFDVRNNDAVVENIGGLTEEWKNIDVLLNNAGLAAGLSPIQDGLISDWEQMIDTNVKGLLYVTKIVSQTMITRKKGHIVNIGSIAGKEVYPNGNVYCGTKHAVDALTKGMRIDLVKFGIKVSSIDPGMVDTEFSLVRLGDKEKADAVYDGLTPLYAEDIADAIDFIISRPAHVNINDMIIMPTAQASAAVVKRE